MYLSLWIEGQTYYGGDLLVLHFQGLEIVNPQAAEKRIAEANQKYFSQTGGFLKVAKKS